jgi:hypothetical protein
MRAIQSKWARDQAVFEIEGDWSKDELSRELTKWDCSEDAESQCNLYVQHVRQPMRCFKRNEDVSTYVMTTAPHFSG